MARKREEIESNNGDKRYIRRDADGQFTEDQSDVGRSLAADRRHSSESKVPKGQGDQGETKRGKRG